MAYVALTVLKYPVGATRLATRALRLADDTLPAVQIEIAVALDQERARCAAQQVESAACASVRRQLLYWLRRAIALQPGEPRQRIAMIEQLFRAGDAGAAESALVDALARFPDSAPLRALLVRISRASADARLPLRVQAKALQQRPDSAPLALGEVELLRVADSPRKPSASCAS